MQKKVPSTRHSKQQRQRFTFDDCETNQVLCQPCNISGVTPGTPEPASPCVTPVFLPLIDTNVPGLPYRFPSANPTNLELAQLDHFRRNRLVVEV